MGNNQEAEMTSGPLLNEWKKHMWYINIIEYHSAPKQQRDFPGSPVVKNPPSNGGDVGSVPGQGAKIPQVGVGVGGETKPAPQLLSPCAQSHKPTRKCKETSPMPQ